MLGASRMVGAHAMGEACQILPTEARAGKWEAVLKALEAFDGEYARMVGGAAPRPPCIVTSVACFTSPFQCGFAPPGSGIPSPDTLAVVCPTSAAALDARCPRNR